MYWNREIETMERERMLDLQLERLKKQVAFVYDNVPFYKKMFDAAGMLPGDIKSIPDLEKLPCTSKTDLRDNYPYGLFAVPMSDVVRIHASSGTTGKATVVGYTREDLGIWDECVARALTCAGGTKDDIVQVCYGYGLFTGGLGLHGGAEKMGATVIPASTGNTARQITMLQDYGSTMLCCTPSYALYIGETLEKNGIPLSSIHLKAGLFGAEPWTLNMKKEIEKRLGITAYDIYGLSEICGPGVSFGCDCSDGLHVNDDHFLIEIVDPATGKNVPDGMSGEVVFTALTKRALPLIRYNTHDIASVTHEKCGCGRTLTRMSRITGRSDDMLIIRGVNVFPSQIESVLLSVGQVAPYYMIVVDRVNNLDVMEIKVELDSSAFSDTISGMEELENKIRASIESTLGISSKITFVEPSSLPRSEGKAKRVIDNRELR